MILIVYIYFKIFSLYLEYSLIDFDYIYFMILNFCYYYFLIDLKYFYYFLKINLLKLELIY